MKASKVLNKIFLLSTSFHTALMGTVFIIQVLRIYFFNDKTFNREICGQYILEILPVLIIWVLLIIGSFIYFNITNFKYKNISKISNVTKKENLERICPEIMDEGIKTQLDKIKNDNDVALITVIIIVIISCIMGLCYLLNIKHFNPDGDLFDQAAKMSLHLMPWVIISFVSFILYAFHLERTSHKACTILIEVIKTNGKVKKEELKQNNIVKYIAQGAIVCIALVLIIMGINNGETQDVLQKAVNICTECIGLG